METDFDILIIGAGLSGIGAAFHVQEKCPSLTYAVLEARHAIGGTWDLFRYPGVRSDSDMYTLGYSFRPWKAAKAIADGPAIRNYICETAKEQGIDKNIKLNHKLIAADWESRDARWTLSVQVASGETTPMRCRFVIMCAGYYDYDAGYTPEFPGRADFKGKFIHPQKWDESTDYADKSVVVIGSGATAVTLVPELAKRAKHVVMLQRSPSYILTMPSVDSVAELLKRALPALLAHRLIRWKNIVFSFAVFRICRKFPAFARRVLLGLTRRALHGKEARMQHFNPTYEPWDQRLCFVPDGDFYHALNGGNAEIVTDCIETFTSSGIRTKSGRTLDADIIVSATGLKLKFLGGVSLRVDGRLVDLRQTIPYKGAMLSGVPNLGMAFGYTNASWTLKCDLICDWLARVLQYMDAQKFGTVTPEQDPDIDRVPLIDFSSGYFERARDLLPRQGKHSPWKLNQSYFADLLEFRAKPINDRELRFS